MEINKEDFLQWVNSPVWDAFNSYIMDEAEVMDSLTASKQFQENAYFEALSPLEAAGLECLLRTAVIRGLEYSIDRDAFHDFCFGGNDA